ncbi:MAG: acyltransferase [Roseibacillus sp.]
MKGRIRELDGVRGIAILMVLVWHYVTGVEKEVAPGSLVEGLLQPTGVFWSGVDLFFVLSGFLIGGIILDSCRKKNFLKVFWIRRSCRILPVLGVLLISCYGLKLVLSSDDFGWLFFDLMPWYSYATFTQNFFMASGGFGGNFLGVTWSLAVEEQFYIVAPLLILLIGRVAWVKSIVPLILVAFLLRLALPGFHTYVVTLFRMDALMAGVAVAVLVRSEAIWSAAQKLQLSILLCFMVMLCITFTLSMAGGFGSFKYSWFAILYATFLLVALLYRGSGLTWVLRSPGLCFWGSISYGLYMYHQAVAGLLHGWVLKAPPSLLTSEAMWVMLGAFVVSTAVAWVSARTVERFFLKLGKRSSYGEGPRV